MIIKSMVYKVIFLMVFMPAINVNAAIKVIDWMDIKKAPQYSEYSAQTIVIQAYDLDFGKFIFPNSNISNNVILIADTLRFSNLVEFNFSNSEIAASNLLIIARQIIVGEDGILSFRTIGKDCGNIRIYYGSIKFETTKSIQNWKRFKLVKKNLQHNASFSGYQDKFNNSNITDIAKQIVSTQMSVDILTDMVVKQPTLPSEYPITFKMGMALQGAVWFTCASYTTKRGELIFSDDLEASSKYVPNDAKSYLSKWNMFWVERLKKQINKFASLGNRTKLLEQFQKLKTMITSKMIVASDRERYFKIITELIKFYPLPRVTVDSFILGNPSNGEEQFVMFNIKNLENEDLLCSSIKIEAKIEDSGGNLIAQRNIIAHDVIIPANSLKKQQEANKDIINELKQTYDKPRIVELGKPSYSCKAKWLSNINI
jgi:hypothetical protein